MLTFQNLLKKISAIMLVSPLLFPCEIFAGSSGTISASDFYVSFDALQYKGSADSQGFGELIGNTFGLTFANQDFFRAKYPDSKKINRSYIETDSSLATTGLTYTYNGMTYPVFDSGIAGIGFIYAIKDTNATNWVAPAAGEKLQAYPATGTATDGRTNIGYQVKFQFVKTAEHLVSGTYTVPLTYIAQASAVGSDVASASIYLNPVTITVMAASCTVNSGDNHTIDLGSISAAELPSVGSISTKKSFSVLLQCDEGVTVSGTLTDQTNSTNTSDIVSLTSDSTASGVGVQFFYNGSSSPVSLGPDSSAKDNTNQFTINSALTSANEAVSVPFSVGYIRTGDMSAGTANAIASLTFSYQ